MPEFTELWAGGPVFAQAEHFRLGTDSVLLADFVNTSGAARGVDLGCASGAIALLLLARSPALHMTGLELLPLPPLDGGRIAVSLLPHRLAWKFAQLERWGFPILLLLLFTGILGAVMNPLVILSARAIESIFGLY